MARSVLFVNASGTPWVLRELGAMEVPAGGTLDVSALASDSDLIHAIQMGLGVSFDAQHHLRVNGVDFSAAQSLDYGNQSVPHAPAVHAPQHEVGGGDQVTIENLLTAGGAGEVPKSTGGGSLAMDFVAHAELTGVSSDQHHAKMHAHDGVDGSGTVAHANTTGQTANDHHAQSHAHNGIDGSGTVAHSSTTGQTANDHHPQLHKASHVSGAGDQFVATDIIEAIVKRIRETAGPATLDFGAILAGQYLRREGATVVGKDREIFFQVEMGSISGDYNTEEIGANASGRMTFKVPADFTTLVSLQLVGIVTLGAAGAGKNIDLLSDYAAIGEDAQTHSQSDTTSTYDLTGQTNRIYSFNIAPLYTNLAAGDFGGLQIIHNAIGGSIFYLGVRMVYR